MQENIHHDDDQEDRFDECLDDVLDGSIEERLHAHHRLQFEPCGQAGPNLVRHLVDIPDDFIGIRACGLHDHERGSRIAGYASREVV